jgi:rhodanese-related sulfurtransferase
MNSSDIITLAAGVLLIGWILYTRRPRVPLAEAQAAIKSGAAVLIDVREPAEWRGGMAAEAHGLPLSDLSGDRTAWKPFLEAHPKRRFFLYCQSGARSSLAARRLQREGIDAVNVGSFRAWRRSGWPVKI